MFCLIPQLDEHIQDVCPRTKLMCQYEDIGCAHRVRCPLHNGGGVCVCVGGEWESRWQEGQVCGVEGGRGRTVCANVLSQTCQEGDISDKFVLMQLRCSPHRHQLSSGISSGVYNVFSELI